MQINHNTIKNITQQKQQKHNTLNLDLTITFFKSHQISMFKKRSTHHNKNMIQQKMIKPNKLQLLNKLFLTLTILIENVVLISYLHLFTLNPILMNRKEKNLNLIGTKNCFY